MLVPAAEVQQVLMGQEPVALQAAISLVVAVAATAEEPPVRLEAT
jgi:hypothetical protein